LEDVLPTGIKVQVRKVGLLPGYVRKENGAGSIYQEGIMAMDRLAIEGHLVMVDLDPASLVCVVFVARLAQVARVVQVAKGPASLGEEI
jgi:hypothetical protein